MPKSFMVLGGAGDMGSSVVEELASSGVEELVVADINLKAAERLASRLRKRGLRAKALKVDAADGKALTEALRQVDVAVNTVGPFYRYEVKVLEAVLGLDLVYVDICDDYDVTLEVFRKRRFEGVRACAVVGLGWTPGITNVCARDGHGQLDEASEINIAWAGSAADASGMAVIEHVFHSVTGEVPMYIEGELKMVPARQFHREVVFPEPVGKLDTYYTGHPEPITIPIYLKGVRNVTVRGALSPQWLNPLLSQLADIGLTEDRPVDVGGVKVSARRFLVSFVHESFDQFRLGGADRSAFWVEVVGKRGGKNVVLKYYGADKMRRLTGIPAAVGALLLSGKGGAKRGVHAPEGVIEPSRFFEELRKRGVKVGKRVEVEEF